MLWLHSAPRATLHVFDLFGLPHSLASRSLVRAAYPGRVHFHEGDSRVTVAAFARRVANGTTAPCDLFFVDGAHTGRTPRHDFNNAIRASRPGALVVARLASLYTRRPCQVVMVVCVTAIFVLRAAGQQRQAWQQAARQQERHQTATHTIAVQACTTEVSDSTLLYMLFLIVSAVTSS